MPTPSKERLAALFSQLPCDALLIEDEINLLYLLGFPISSGTILLHPHHSYLLVDGRYYEQCLKRSPFPVLLAQEHALSSLLNELPSITTLGFSSSETSYLRFLGLQEEIRKASHPLSLAPLDSPLRPLRAIKTVEEMGLLRQAAILGSQGFDYVCRLLKEGIAEAQIALELELFWKRHGAKGVAFEPIIAFGTNSSMPHHRAGSTQLKKGHPVLIDIGVTYAHYHSDMTRTLFFGHVEPQLLPLYDCVFQAQQAALHLCRPGTPIGALDLAARNLIAEAGYGENFTHSLGHGIGLAVHEFPILRNKPPYADVLLEAGMVITLEPGIYLPKVGGIRIEDTIIITEKGYENLTNRSKEILIL
ncbi:Xaa-Pro peptidase family protein [Parachlamydia sp. AcF125]|uniref:M24 family metallopeptidase n=1 Tax=Parachlamydia sp. AcF125 TaxID=2795736 RepID=UPI001BC928B3|nr:Xaa-Pro peptidase family protein [Parachlamydia sp. AcF125]MBS4168000.1 Aminopeptidase YpdF [Parachlamydia sp. AcF125]